MKRKASIVDLEDLASLARQAGAAGADYSQIDLPELRQELIVDRRKADRTDRRTSKVPRITSTSRTRVIRKIKIPDFRL